MEHYLENPDSLDLEGLAGFVFVHSSCHEPLGLELEKVWMKRAGFEMEK